MRIDSDTCRDPGLLSAEVRRLQAVIDSGAPTLTDAEREAIGNAILELDGILEEFIPTPVEVRIRRDVRTLRGLLERTK